MCKSEEEPSLNTDVVLAGPVDFDTATARILDELKRQGVGSGYRSQAGLSLFDLANHWYALIYSIAW